MKTVRRASEAEVIAEFLKNEFYLQEFHRDRDRFEQLVMHADTSDERENALRRALLFRRRGPMWRELPPDTQWWMVDLERSDLDRIYVFPRAYWRKIAAGNFALPTIVDRLRARGAAPVDSPNFVPADGRAPRTIQEFIAKIRSLNHRLRNQADAGAVLLIGTAEDRPMLIFEGNHRLTAALLASPDAFHERFRVFFGASPNMVRCCWYRTNFWNLLRYVRNRVLHLGYDREADVDRVLRELEAQPAAGYASAIPASKVLPESKSAPTKVS